MRRPGRMYSTHSASSGLSLAGFHIGACAALLMLELGRSRSHGYSRSRAFIRKHRRRVLDHPLHAERLAGHVAKLAVRVGRAEKCSYTLAMPNLLLSA